MNKLNKLHLNINQKEANHIMNIQRNICIAIPALDPDDKMLELIKNLKEYGFENIICIDDGSDSEHCKFFEIAKTLYQCSILTHCINLGKGRALKTVFNYVCNELPECIGIITVDSDGQHTISDILSCAQALLKNPDSLILGCRNFSANSTNGEQIPFRSRFGNIFTSKVIRLLCGIHLSDTQTGLRGISKENMKRFLDVKGERFEYEMNMILQAHELEINLLEIPISTTYLEENKSSHFNPLTDSLKIYVLFGKYILSALSSFLLDIVLFSILVWIFKPVTTLSLLYITIATIGARIISSIYNFMMNYTRVFKTSAKTTHCMARYFTLCIIQLGISSFLVTLVYRQIELNETLIKIIVDTMLFFISFFVQKEWVFKHHARQN